MGLNRMMLISKHTTGGGTTGDNASFVITMGQNGYQYGFSSYNNTFGEVEDVQHEGKAVTLIMLCLYSSFLDFAFNVEGVTSGSYNVTIKITSMETNTTANIEFPVIKYQSFLPGFYEYTQNLTSDAASMFSRANVGKQFKVELIFN